MIIQPTQNESATRLFWPFNFMTMFNDGVGTYIAFKSIFPKTFKYSIIR